MNVVKKFQVAQKLLEQAKKEIIARVRNLPDNPSIHRLNDNSFTMKLSDMLVDGWSPEYYDFTYQYQAVIEVLNNTEPSKVLDKLSDIVRTGVIKGAKTRNKVKLHPAARDRLESLLGEISTETIKYG